MQFISIDFLDYDDDDDESVMGNKASIYRIRETYWIFEMLAKFYVISLER